MKIFTLLGARPQFIKAATVSRAIRAHDGIREIIVHTGRHFDANMSDVFFDQLDMPRPDYHLRYVHTRIGVGGRMDTLQCAVLLAKLPRFDHEVARRITLGQRCNALVDQAGITRIQQRPDRTSVFAQYTVQIDDRDALQAKLQAAGIPTAVHYPVPLNQQPAYAHLCCPDYTPVAVRLAQRVMSLPMSPDMTESNLERIVDALHASCNPPLSPQ